jgi:DHA2 family multidrug resistance protein
VVCSRRNISKGRNLTVATATVESTSSSATEERVTFRQWVAVAGAIIGSFCAVLNHQITNTSLREIQAALSANLTEASWITTAYLAAAIVVMPLTAWFARVFSVRGYATANITLFMLSLVACALAWDLNAMIALRFVAGLFGGGLMPMAFTVILTTLPESKRPIAFMFWALLTVQAPTVGPALGGWLTDTFSWELIFFVQLIPAGVSCACLIYGLDRTSRNLGLLRHIQWFSIASMAVGLFLFITVLEEGNQNDWFTSDYITLLATISGLCLLVFVSIQLIKKEPYINLRLFGRRNFGISCFIFFGFGIGVYGTMFIIALYLIQVPQYTATQVSTVVMWIGIPQIVAAPFVLWLLPRVDARVLLGIGCVLFSVSCFLNTNMSFDTGYWELMFVNVVRAVGQPFIMVVLPIFATSLLEPSNHGSAAAIINMIRDMGGAVGIACLNTGISRRSDFHVDHMREHVSTYDAETTSRLDQLTQHFFAYSGDLQLAQDQAVAALNALVARDATIMAYNDMFFVIGLIFLIGLVACFFLRKAPAQRRG